MKQLVIAAVLAACSQDSDVVGPYSGPTHRYVVDRITVPHDAEAAGALAADLDGDGMGDNKLGYATAVLAVTSDLSPHASDMIASGALASTVEIRADDLLADDRVGVWYYGAAGDPADPFGGRVSAGAFVSNRTRDTAHPGRATVHLPVFVNADPVVLVVERAEIELVPDGSGGFDGILRGGIRERAAREAAHASLVEMFETEPERHLVFMRGVDENRDDVLAYEELEVSVIGLLVASDLEPDLVSIGFGFHLAPCPDGNCALGTPADRCRDRLRDGGETDVDCGGSCQPCWTAKRCVAPADCQSRACVAGACAAPSCSDGVRDGWESDVDCGGVCSTCATGKTCAADRDCESAVCDNGPAAVGSCVEA